MVNGQAYVWNVLSPHPIPHGKHHRIYRVGGWMGTRAGLDAVIDKIPVHAGSATPILTSSSP
jgi:hypothetical protein